MENYVYGPNRDTLKNWIKANSRSKNEEGEDFSSFMSWRGKPRSREMTDRTEHRMYGSCTVPVIMHYQTDTDHERHVPCRNCPGCLRSRRYLWQMRGEAETIKSERTWFFTGTFRDQHHDIEPCNEELTLFLKRLRDRQKQKDQTIRYLMIPERHKSGAIHFHGLLHGSVHLTYRDVRSSWGAGFSDPRLVDGIKSASYVTKYSTKGIFEAGSRRRPRIRASRSPTYGGWIVNREQLIVQRLKEELGVGDFEANIKRMLIDRPERNIQDIWKTNLKMALDEYRNIYLKTPTIHQKIMDQKILKYQNQNPSPKQNQ